MAVPPSHQQSCMLLKVAADATISLDHILFAMHFSLFISSQLSLVPRYAPFCPPLPTGQPRSSGHCVEDHGHSFGHFINGGWVRSEGRKTYDTHNPATGEKQASTVQGQQPYSHQWRQYYMIVCTCMFTCVCRYIV